ncbi:MAG: arsenate reductase ArsC [Moraxellaceae bacterium]|nr:arsenate reductase ArsC [Moraxellaceae bacterium]
MSADPRPRWLFVCVENAGRSQMAEALVRMLGQGRIDVVSAGSHPVGRLNVRAVAVMAELGYDLTTHGFTALSELPAGEWDKVITMGCGDACPFVLARSREDWQLPDPKAMDIYAVRALRDEIRARVEGLLAQLPNACS